MKKPTPLPVALRGRTFSLTEQRAAGVLAHRAWAQDLHVASRGIRVPWGAEQELVERVRVITRISPGCLCCGPTAVLIWTCPLPLEIQRDFSIHLTRADGGARPVRKGVKGHRAPVSSSDTRLIDGVPLTGPARTWLDLAPILALEDLVAAADHFVCNQSRSFGRNRLALCSLDDLRRQVAQNPGSRGIRKAGTALELARVGADSVPETKLRLALGRGGLPEPELSFVVCDPTGWQLAWADLAYPEFRLAVNYDGSHHLTAEQKESDIRREESLAALGWISVTVTATHVKAWGFDGVVPRVRDALVRRGWRSEG